MKIFILMDRLTNMPAGTHFSSVTDASAVRNCLVNFKGNMEAANQFDLYCVGLYDDTTGKITDTTVTLVCNLAFGPKLIEDSLKS